MSFANRQNDLGLALPAALFLVLFIASMGGLLSSISISTQRTMVQTNYIEDNFHSSEGAVHEIMRQMAANPELWREMDPLADEPDGYDEYSPVTYAAYNGIPPCSGLGCHREMYPTGGGLLKNLGPISADGEEVDVAYSITQQLDVSTPPVADITLNGQSAWSQVERLDEVLISEDSLGGSLSNDGGVGESANSIRFRVTGVSSNSLKGRRGTSTVIYVVEVPGT